MEDSYKRIREKFKIVKRECDSLDWISSIKLVKKIGIGYVISIECAPPSPEEQDRIQDLSSLTIFWR